MPQDQPVEPSPASFTKGLAALDEDWTQLRSLLLAPEQTQLDEIRERLDNLVIHARDISRVLPDAFTLRGEQDPPLSKALAPYVENGFIAAVRKSPRTIVDAIAPIMGPAIRQAITRALQGMMQSFNQTMDESLSIRGLRWRFEAWRTGRSFAEVVLLHTLRYRVEQVFLIHRTTGLLLHHVATESAAVQDQHLVSGMLTAIQEYVRDSFGATRDEMLDHLQVGEWTVWIEHGSHAYVAAVVRGTPPTSLRQNIRDVVDDLHVRYASALEQFSGDPTPFHATHSHLEACVQAHYDLPPKPGALKLWILGGGLLLLLSWWGWATYHTHARWLYLVDQLQAEPGIVVTQAQPILGGYRLEGLRDPLAKDPLSVIREAGIEPSIVMATWSSFYALEPQLILTRARTILQPPDTVQFHMDGDTLVATGVASHEWVRETRRLAVLVPGISHYRDEGLFTASIPDLLKQVSRTIIHFNSGSAQIEPSEHAGVTSAADALRDLGHAALQAGRRVRLEIRGWTDETGSASTNAELGKRRAQSVFVALGGERLGSFMTVMTSSGSELDQRGVLSEYAGRRVVAMQATVEDFGQDSGTARP